jgi:hypothetical protein
MKLKSAICVFLLQIFVLSPVLYSENNKVAIVEFQNKAETIITANRWTMAEDLAKELKKKNKKIQTVSRKDILKQLKELSWEGDRLSQEQEGKLASSGIKYVVYGNIARWRVRSSWSGGEVRDPAEAMLVFSFDVMDLTTGERLQSFTVEGGASGEVGYIRDGDPAAFDDDRYEQEMYDATEVALKKAAGTLSDLLQQ